MAMAYDDPVDYYERRARKQTQTAPYAVPGQQPPPEAQPTQPQPAQQAPQTAQQATQTAPQQQATREMIRDAWMARGAGQTPQDLQNFISQYSYYNPQIVNSGAGGEKVRWDFGNGKVEDLDMIIDVGGKGLAGWGGYAGGLGYNGGNVPAAAPAGNAALTPGGPGPTAYTSNPAAQSALMQALMARLTQNKVPGKDDPTIREASDRFAAQQERARRLSESEAAERLSAKRLGSSGVMDVERRMASERAGEASGAFESQLVLREIDARRQEIQQAIQSLQGIISQDQMMALQRELANLNAALDRERLASSTGLGYAQLAQQASQFGDTMGLNWANFNRQGDPEYLAYISSLR